ncbi:thiaminase II [Paenilisteria newyorkensis]|uniref:thiaminase II n=1 Tax=Listeria newyorkensis TaxID=1497681 RepID=UPI000690ED6A|nr:thiaminase II [Listeria newyorkensis]WAO22842.1 thiaminase II [Listeria newyorkensis]SQC58707.1 Thiaminase-2 [Listeria newyorkensis]
MVRFSEELHAENREIWQRSKDHRFVQQLVDGSLDRSAFRYYLLQDHYYLTHYVKVIALGIAYADDYGAMMELSQSLASLEASELSMREKFYPHVGIETADLDGILPSPAAYHYTSHMYRLAGSQSLGRILAGILPCYWLYREIGEQYAGCVSPDPLYQAWLDIYQDAAYAEGLQRQIDLLDRVAQGLPDGVLAEMRADFRISSYAELAFWDMGFERQTWDGRGDLDGELATY